MEQRTTFDIGKCVAEVLLHPFAHDEHVFRTIEGASLQPAHVRRIPYLSWVVIVSGCRDAVEVVKVEEEPDAGHAGHEVPHQDGLGPRVDGDQHRTTVTDGDHQRAKKQPGQLQAPPPARATPVRRPPPRCVHDARPLVVPIERQPLRRTFSDNNHLIASELFRQVGDNDGGAGDSRGCRGR